MSRYGCALGRVLVLAGRLVEPSRLDRLAHARTLAEQLKVLGETEYAALMADVGDRAGARQAIERRVLDALDVLDESFAGAVARFFRLPRDFANVKVALARGRHDLEQPFEAGGTVSVERWEDGDLPAWLAEELKQAEAVGGVEDEAAGLAYADRRMLSTRLEHARRLRDRLAFDLASLDVDWANARMLARGGSGLDLVVGGLVDAGDLAATYRSGGMEGVVGRVARTIGDAGVGQAWWPGASRDRMEVAALCSMVSLARRGRLDTTSSSPIVAWMTSVEAEARLVRLVVLGGLDGAPPDEVVDRVSASHG